MGDSLNGASPAQVADALHHIEVWSIAVAYYLFAASPGVTAAPPRDQLCDRFALPLPLCCRANGVYGRGDAPGRIEPTHNTKRHAVPSVHNVLFRLRRPRRGNRLSSALSCSCLSRKRSISPGPGSGSSGLRTARTTWLFISLSAALNCSRVSCCTRRMFLLKMSALRVFLLTSTPDVDGGALERDDLALAALDQCAHVVLPHRQRGAHLAFV